MGQSDALESHQKEHPDRDGTVLRTISFNDICYLATQSCGVSAAVIISFDGNNQKIHSSFGIDRHKECLWNRDAISNNRNSKSEHLEILGNPFTCGDSVFSYMAGYKVFDADDNVVGLLCVIDDVISKLNSAQSKSLQILTNQVSSALINAKLKIYKNLIEHVVDIIYEMDGKGNYITVNSRFRAFSGYSTNELLQMNYRQIVHEDDIDSVRAYHRKIISQGRNTGYQEFRIKSRKGDVIWIGQNVTFHYQNGELDRVSAVARDISDIVELRDSLLKSEELYRLVTENSRDLTCLTELDGTFIYVSPYSKELLGYEPEELVGKNGYSYFHPDDLQRIKEESRFENSFLSSAQYRFRRKDDTYIWVETVNKKVIEDGIEVSFQSNTRDISGRKEIQEQLERNSAILSSMMENTRDFIFALDKSRKFIYFNSAYRDMYERRTGNAPQVGGEYEFIPNKAEYYKEVFDKVIEGERVQLDLEFEDKSGDLTHFEGYFNPITDKNGRPIGAAAFLRDVTDQKNG